jgi:hypothetical protein
MFLFNAASFFSHTLCGLLLTSAAWLALVSGRDHRMAAAAAAGWLVGWAVVTRYFAGASVGMAVALAIAWPAPSRWRRLLWFALGGLPWVAALAWHNDVLVGSPWLLSLSAKDDTSWRWFASGWVTRGPDMLATNLLRLLLWTPPALLVVYGLWLKWAPGALRRGLEWVPVAVVASLFFYIGRGGNQYGPRYYYEALPFMVVFVGAMVAATGGGEGHPRRRRLVGWLALSVALALPITAGLAWYERRVVTERTDVYTQVRTQRLQRAVVLLAGRVGTLRSMSALDLTRNAIGFTAGVVFALDRPGDERDLASRFPGHRFYRYRWDPRTSRGWLEPIVRVSGTSGTTKTR